MGNSQAARAFVDNLFDYKENKKIKSLYKNYKNKKKAEFNHFASHYDLQTKVVTFGQIGQMRVKQAEMAVGEVRGNALELCCGTGGLTVELASRFEKVVGVDLSPEMLAYADRRLRRGGFKNVELIESEISRVEFESHSFASISISLGLHELPNWLKMPILKKSIEWLKPGGRYVISDYRNPDNKVSRFIFRTFGKPLIEPNLYDEHMAFDIHELMKGFGLKRVKLNRSFFSFFEMCAWASSKK